MAMKYVCYSSKVGSLMYAQVCARSDIAFVMGVLGRFMSNPSLIHYQEIKEVFGYLQGTNDHMLAYQRTNSLDDVGYSNANFKDCVDDKKSTTGYIFVMERGAMSWHSAKQSMTTSSTIEAEYVTCYEATRHAVWLRNFIRDLGVVDFIERPIMMFCDNTITVYFSNNLKGTLGARCIDVNYFVVNEKVEEDLITIIHTSTYSIVADQLTKALSVGIFEEHLSRMDC